MKEHGTVARYRHQKCRCDLCRAAKVASRNLKQESERQKVRRAADPEKHREWARGWRAANPNIIKEQRRLYVQRHPEKVKMSLQKWKESNPDYAREWHLAHPTYAAESRKRNHQSNLLSQDKWRKNNPDKVANYRHKRRTSKRSGGVFLVTARDLNRLLARWYHACAYCGSQERLEWEHVVPISRGGRHSIGNLLPACHSCNSSKGPKLLIEWITWKSRQVRI